LIGSKLALSVLFAAAILLAAAPVAFAVKELSKPADKPEKMIEKDRAMVDGTVTAFVYDDEWVDEVDDDREGDWDKPRLCAFVIDDEIVVEFGPWWYWMYVGINITDVVHIGDEVNVTGEMYEDDEGNKYLDAWHIENLSTDEELTIKEEGRPPWAGGPKALGISPWPPSDEEDD
jgi:hypothetical protein